MTINLNLGELDQEQLDAFDQLAGQKQKEEWSRDVFLGLINEQVVKNIDARGAALIAGAKSLPKEKRLEFNSQVEVLFGQMASSVNE